MTKRERHEKIIEIIRGQAIRSQRELLTALSDQGVVVNQSSISRDLSELGLVKVSGVYRAPFLVPGESAMLDKLEIDTAGDHLIVLKTEVGQASMAGVAIDRARFSEVVGTIAGDDSIFVAVKGRAEQNRAIKKILQLFRIRVHSAS
ncbi:MAG TPA: arginine repressor [Myxococcales bacterium]|nr:arginine repressor [Deltaproteobacteria bacterium]HAA53189.1 arginine repressor [Myxococcales bacterium]|tara:strand:+ start:4865 stop:5305 length:441 start_codon:yes stop_codon:yes gene_type:complete